MLIMLIGSYDRSKKEDIVVSGRSDKKMFLSNICPDEVV